MDSLFTIDNLATLAMLSALQAVLGFDNLLYISIESQRVEASRQAYVRRVGIALAIILRIVLLFALVSAIQYFQEPFLTISIRGIFEAVFNVHALIVLLGGIFIIYTAMKEIMHMMSFDDIGSGGGEAKRSVGTALFWIVSVNMVFSFDSILSAIALTDVFIVMAVSIVISGILMIWLSDHVTVFLQKNRMYEVLGLFILLIVGVLLLSEGGDLAKLRLFGFAVEPMSKTTFYFAIFVMVVVDIVQGRYQKKLLAQKAARGG